MDTLKQHELFEIEVLDRMRSFKLLEGLGTEPAVYYIV